MGTFVVSLVVSDGETESAADYVIVTAEDPTSIPTANAGEDSIATIGQTVVLDGSASSDPEDRELSYSWSLLQVPSSSELTELIDAETASPKFTPDARGVYVVNLTVNNGLTHSWPDTLDHRHGRGQFTCRKRRRGHCRGRLYIQLDGANSADPDGDPLLYFWELQSKPADSSATNANFSDRNSESPTFWADVAGDYLLSLSVFDGTYWSSTDTLNITLSERIINTAPTISITDLPAIAGGQGECVYNSFSNDYDCVDCEDQVVELGPNVTINDSDNDPYTVHWELTSGSGKVISPESLDTKVKLKNIESGQPGLCESNEWTLELTVTDCPSAQTKRSTTVTVACCGI